MSHTSDILTGAETAIRASTTFAAGNVFKRRESASDEFPDDVSVYLIPLNPKANDQPDAQKFTVHPFQVLIVFVEEFISESEGERDVVNERKGEYNDAMVTALRLTMPNQTYPISNVYQVDYLSSDYNPPVADDIKKKDGAERMHRVLQLWNFHAYES